MLVDDSALGMATHWWIGDRTLDSNGRMTTDEDLRSRLFRIGMILPFLFQTLNSFYIVTREIPLQWAPPQNFPFQDGGSNNIIISMRLSPERYQILRTTLALVFDVYLFSKAIKGIGKGKLNGLGRPITQLLKDADQFHNVRNFFTHFDEVLSDPNKHGITGSLRTNYGIEYTETAKGGLYLILSGEKLYFPWHGKPNEVNMGKKAYDGIFVSAKNVYSEIISHKLHASEFQYPSPDSIYPL